MVSEIDAIALACAAFSAGVILRSYWARREERDWKRMIQEAQNDQHYFILRLRTMVNHVNAIHRIVDKVLDSDGGRGGHHALSDPYRGDSTKLVKVLESVREQTVKAFDEAADEDLYPDDEEKVFAVKGAEKWQNET